MGRAFSRWFVGCAVAAALAGPASSAGRPQAPVSAPIARDGPFGIAIGEPLGDLGHLEKVGPEYQVLSPPRPSPDIIVVYVIGFPSTGVCMITGVTHINHNDPNSIAGKQLVDALANILVSKYGPFARKVDKCDSNTATCEGYLTQAIQDKSADYAYAWLLKRPRPDHILGVDVSVEALDANSTAARVEYFSDNEEACQKAANASAASAF